ncbi:MAG: hypothetical protein K0U98_17675 [Deltaproteobacteria bacterium]|nr:hypothetical protein [Deltaproteobacteria bacterium]
MTVPSDVRKPLDEEALGRALEILPHRPPFLLLDRALEVVPGERGRAVKVVTGNEPYVGAGQALMSPLVVEACAQLMAVVAGATEGEEEQRSESKPGYLVALEGFDFRRHVGAGDRLVVEAVLGRRMGPLLQAKVRAQVEGELVVEGKITVSSPR